MWRYRLLLILLALPLVIYTGWIALREKDFRYFRERLGFTTKATPGGIWVHAASVGEVVAVMPLIQLLAKTHPDTHLTLSTNTSSGALIARRQLPAQASLHFLPIDWGWASGKFLNAVSPRCALIMETELWPNIYNHCAVRNIPLLIINGRLSIRTMRAKPWLRRLYVGCFNATRAVLARSESDRERFIELGASAAKVTVTGNIKYASTKTDTAAAMDLGRPYVLAASTHDDEELRLARLWLGLGLENTTRLLVIAPRHPKRLGAILNQLESLGTTIAIRSRNEAITPATRIYLADTFGEMPELIAGSELVFMGGSLVPVGGHNILEAGTQGKAVVFGPHMENFTLEAEEFLRAGAGLQVANEQQLADCLVRLLEHPDEVERLGRNGAALMQKNTYMAQNYLDQVVALCPEL